MRTQKRTRLLSALMALLMVFSLLPASALAADASSTWEAVDLTDIKETDTVAITMTKDNTTWVLPAAESSKQPQRRRKRIRLRRNKDRSPLADAVIAG